LRGKGNPAHKGTFSLIQNQQFKLLTGETWDNYIIQIISPRVNKVKTFKLKTLDLKSKYIALLFEFCALL